MRAFLLSLLPAWLVCFTAASLAHTQSVLAGLTALDINIPLSKRLSMTLFDLSGLFPSYGLGVLLALLLALGFYHWLFRPWRISVMLYAVAGAMGIATLLLAMYPVMHITLLAGARGPFGFTLQCLAGALGGVVFAQVIRRLHIDSVNNQS